MYRVSFFYQCFLSRTFTIQKTAGEGKDYFFKSFLPLPTASQTPRQAITADSSYHIVISYLAAGHEPGTFGFREQVANHQDTRPLWINEHINRKLNNSRRKKFFLKFWTFLAEQKTNFFINLHFSGKMVGKKTFKYLTFKTVFCKIVDNIWKRARITNRALNICNVKWTEAVAQRCSVKKLFLIFSQNSQ